VAVWIYYLVTGGLIVALAAAAALNVVSLPGNWLIAAMCGLFAWLVHGDNGQGMSWFVVGLLVCLAGAGEVAEMLAGSAGAARRGASRRGMMMSLVGSFVGSIAGAFVGLPIPIVGSAVAAMLFGAIGAFVGAFLGERAEERSLGERMSIGSAALVGRVLGTASKLLVGVVMVVVAAVDALS
jgi:uncharacterized protein YqgC (DUF456 family)